MSDFLPPLIAEIRANAAQFYREVGKVGASVKKLEKETEGGLSPAQKSFRTLAGVGKAAALGLAGAAAVVGYESLKMATSFQSKITLLHTAAGESQANLKMVANGILNLAEATGTSVSQLADGAYIAEKAGYRGAEMLNVLKAASQGAKAEGVDLGTAMTALTSVMQSYGLKAKDAVSVENMLVRGSGLAKTTMQEYAGSLSTVVPLAAKLGVQFPELAGAIATMTQHGTSAQEATHELDNALRSLSGANSVAVNAMGQLGLSSVKVAQTLGKGPNGLQNAIDMVVNAIQAHMGPSGLVVTTAFKQSSAATADLKSMLASMPPALAKLSQGFLNGSVNLTTYRKQTRGMGADGYAMGAQFMTLAAKARGFNDMVKAGNPAAVTFAQYLKQMMGGATGLNTALMLTGNSAAYFKSATDQVAAAGAHAGANIDTWAATSKTLKVQLDQTKEGAQVLGIRIGTWLIPKVAELIHILTVSVGWLEKHKTVALILAGAIGGVLVLAMGAWAAATWTAVAANLGLEGSLLPIILIAAAVGVAILLLWKYWRQAWDGIKIAAMAVWNYVLKPQFDAMIKVWDVLKAAIGVAVGWIVSHWRILATAAATILLGPIGGALVYLATHWSQVWGGIEAVTEAVWHDGIKPVFDAIKESWLITFAVMRGAWDAAKSIFADIEGAFRWVEGVVRSVMDGIGNVWSQIWAGIENAASTSLGAMKGALNDVIAVINEGINLINDLINGVNDATGGVSSLWSWTGIPSIPSIPHIPNIPYLAAGGVVTRATLAMIGERGPEAVIPLNRPAAQAHLARSVALPLPGVPGGSAAAGGGGGDMYVTVQGSIIDKDGFFRAVQEGALQHGARNSQTWAPYARRR